MSEEDRRILSFYISIPVEQCGLTDVAWEAVVDQKVAAMRSLFAKARAAYPGVAVGDEFLNE